MTLSLNREKYERLMNGFKLMGYNPTLKLSEKKNNAELLVSELSMKFIINEEDGQPDTIASALLAETQIDPTTYNNNYKIGQRAVRYYQLQTNPWCPRCNASLIQKGVYQLTRLDYQFNRQDKSLIFSPAIEPTFVQYHCCTCHQPLDEAYTSLLTFEKTKK